MRSFITIAVSLAFTAAYIWNYSLPLLDQTTADWANNLSLLTLLIAIFFGGLFFAGRCLSGPYTQAWQRPARKTFLLLILFYLLFNVPNGEGRVLVTSALNLADELATSRTDLIDGLKLLWAETRGQALSEKAFDQDWFLWMFIVPLVHWLCWLPAWKSVSRDGALTLFTSVISAVLIATLGSLAHLQIAGAAIAAPFGIFVAASWIGALFQGKDRQAASVRQPGIKTRMVYSGVAVIAGLYVWLYSIPALTSVGTGESWGLWEKYLCALLCLCLFLTFSTRLSPFALPLRAPLLKNPIPFPFLGGVAFFAVLAVSTDWKPGLGWTLVYIWIALIAGGSLHAMATETPLKWRPALSGVAGTLAMATIAWLSITKVGLNGTKTAALSIAVPFALFWLSGLPVIIPELLKEASLYRMLYVLGRGGSARFGGVYSFFRYDFTQRLHTPDDAKGPIYIGKTTFDQDPKVGGRHIGLDTDAMTLSCAGMGGGKSYTGVWNTLCGKNWPGGAFVLDPKGEHAQRTGKTRAAENGAPSHYLDAWGEVPHLYGASGPAGFNPFEEIDLESPNASSDLKQIAEACYLPESQESANSKHFRENAITVAVGVMAHILSTMDPEHHNLPSVFNTFLTGHPDGGAADPKAFDDLVIQMAVNEAFSRAPMKAAKVLDAAGENERGGFLTSVATGLEWVIDDVFRPILMKSTFKMSDIKQKRHTVYMIVPFRKMQDEGVKRFMRMVTNFALWGCSAPAKHSYKTLILLDEFPQLGTFNPIKEGLVTLRSIDVKIWMHCQHVGQLKERYGNWQDFMSACDKQFFAVNDEESAKTISGLLGEYMEPSSGGRHLDKTRPLRAPSEVLQDLRKGSGIQYLLPADGQPMRLKLVPFKKLHARYGKVR